MAGGQVDDAQAPGRQADAVGEKEALVVGTAMNDLVVHPFQGRVIGLALSAGKIRRSRTWFILC